MNSLWASRTVLPCLVALLLFLVGRVAAAAESLVNEIQQLTADATALEKAGKYADSVKLWKRRLGLIRDLIPADFNEPVQNTKELVAVAQERAGDFKNAARTWRDLAEIRANRRELRPGAEAVALAQAARLEKLAAGATDQTNGPNAVAASAEILPMLTAIEQERGDQYAAAARSWRQVAEIRKKRTDTWPWHATDAAAEALRMDELAQLTPADRKRLKEAVLMRDRGFYLSYNEHKQEEGGKLIREALAVEEAIVGRDSLRVAVTLTLLGMHAGIHREHSSEISASERAVRIRSAALGVHPLTAEVLRGLSGAYWRAGDHQKSLPIDRQEVEMFIATLGEDHPDTLISLASYASNLEATGDYGGALSYREMLVDSNRRAHGNQSHEAAAELVNLGRLHFDLLNRERAISAVQEALRIERALQPDGSSATAHVLDVLATVTSNEEESERYREEAHAIRTKVLAQSFEQTESGLEDRLDLLNAEIRYTVRRKSGYAKVLSLVNAAKELQQPLVELGNRLVAREARIHAEGNFERELADAALAAGDLAAAENHLHRASLHDKTYFTQPWLQAWDAHLLALVRLSSNPNYLVVRQVDGARRILQQYRMTALRGLSDREQLAYLILKESTLFNRAIAVALGSREQAAVAVISAEWVLNTKNVAGEILADRALVSRISNNAELERLRSKLQVARGRLAAEYQSGQSLANDSRIRELAEAERVAAREFALASGKALADQQWVELSDVRAAIPVNAVLVEIVRMDRDGTVAWTKNVPGNSRYAAWIIPPARSNEPVTLIDLGDAAVIDQSVAAAQQALRTPATQNAQSAGFAANLLRPLEARLTRFDHWIISPDADLWLVPWNALPLEDGPFVVEKHTISLVVSGRDLLRKPRTGSIPGPALVLADPDYNAPPMAGSERPIEGGEAPGNQEKPAKAGAGLLAAAPAADRSLRGRNWPPLPGTATEAKAIEPRLATLAKSASKPPLVFTGKEAREEVFKATARPEVLVLSTHGYFLEDQSPAAGTRGADIVMEDLALPRPGEAKPVRVFQPLDNPLLRCGLVLAGANQRNKVQSGEDGLLTGLEVLDADLRGTKLVVLSACETAKGEIHNGQGVAGLRQAFQLAGAESVVATLWKIPDTETADLMSRFFEHLAAGKGRAQSLQLAQRDFIHARRKAGQSAHPYFWAAFTLTGQHD